MHGSDRTGAIEDGFHLSGFPTFNVHTFFFSVVLDGGGCSGLFRLSICAIIITTLLCGFMLIIGIREEYDTH